MVKILDNTLYVSEIFESISGEVAGFPQGTRCTFIRLAGCNLKCDFCDAWETQICNLNQKMTLPSIFDKVEEFKNKSIVITGGEPLLQSGRTLGDLILLLKEVGCTISIETNGTYRVPPDILRASTIVMDFKINYIEKMESIYFLDLKSTDFIKFVISNDIEMALALCVHKELCEGGCVANFAYSPMLLGKGHNIMRELKERADIILNGLAKTKMDGILNIQIHKLINQP